MPKKMSEKELLRNLCKSFFDLYLAEHGGLQNQPYVCMLWMFGRVNELAQLIQEQADKLKTPVKLEKEEKE